MTVPVIFACVHSAGRSQMAAAFFNALADPAKARAIAAGTEPGERVHPEVVATMNEVGIDLCEHRAKGVKSFLRSGLAPRHVIIVCKALEGDCPKLFPRGLEHSSLAV